MTTDPDSGIDVMRARIARGRRLPPRPRRPSEADAPGSAASPAVEPRPTAPTVAEPAEPAPADPPPTASAPAAPGGGARTRTPQRTQERLSPTLPSANLAIRVRRPLDDRLADVIHELRREGVRTSKVEIVEMLLWELDASDLDGLRKRIARFRRAAPRAVSADPEA